MRNFGKETYGPGNKKWVTGGTINKRSAHKGVQKKREEVRREKSRGTV